MILRRTESVADLKIKKKFDETFVTFDNNSTVFSVALPFLLEQEDSRSI